MTVSETRKFYLNSDKLVMDLSVTTIARIKSKPQKSKINILQTSCKYEMIIGRPFLNKYTRLSFGVSTVVDKRKIDVGLTV